MGTNSQMLLSPSGFQHQKLDISGCYHHFCTLYSQHAVPLFYKLKSFVQSEVKSAFNFLVNPDWQDARQDETTFQPSREKSYSVTLKPGTRSSTVQLVGHYGPYTVHAPTPITFITESC